MSSQPITTVWRTLDQAIPPMDPQKYLGSVDVIVRNEAGVTAIAYYDYDREDFYSALSDATSWKMASPTDHPDINTYETWD